VSDTVAALPVAVPPHVFVTAPDALRPAGRASVNATPVRPRVVLGLEMVKVSEVDAPVRIDAAPNAFEIAGGVATDRLALAVLPDPPFVDVTGPVVLVY
jgi:hypothetical protein